MSGLRAAASLMTRLPVGGVRLDRATLTASVAWFPAVGAMVGLGIAGVYVACALILPSLLAAALAVAVGVVITGALHEDGLADTADAFAGGWTREERLRILKDPTHGTYGVLAIGLSVVLRVAAMSILGTWTALAVIPAAHALSRTACAVLLGVLPPAAADGLGASYRAHRGHVVVAVVIGLAVAVAALGAWAPAAAAAVAAVTWFAGRVAMETIGGVTGDVLGAAQQAAEVAVLLLGAGVVHGRLPLPLW
jgi:adenosylcobinamide-GDP ribazoletransferase